MLRSYLKIAFRNIKRFKAYGFISIAGLAFGMACCLVIIVFVRDELTYDRFHRFAHRTYRITATMNMGGGEVPVAAPGPLGPALVQSLPAVVQATRVRCSDEPLVVQHGAERFSESGICFTDPTLFEVFDFSLRSGSPETALAEPYNLTLSPELAQKYFGNDDPVGQVLRINGEHGYTVTGILASPPGNTHLQFGLLASFATLEALDPAVATWAEGGANPYVVLASNYHAEELKAHLDEHLNDYMGFFAKGITAHIEPLTDIYLFSGWPPGLAEVRGNMQYLYLFSIVAILILLLACINYMNLATARALRRAREVGVRKALGAARGQLIRQFLSESILLSFIALLFAFVLAWLVLPHFGGLIDRTLPAVDLFDADLLLIFIGITLLVGIIAGSYPAFYLSAFDPVAVLKGRPDTRGSGAILRKGLVVVQFAVSIGLAVSTVVLWQQLHYMREAKLGFDKEQILLITPNDVVRPQYSALKQEFLRLPGVVNVTTAPFPGWTHVGIRSSIPEGTEREDGKALPGIPTYEVDYHFLETLGIKLVAGRDFDENRPGDREGVILINEALAQELGWTNALGKTITQPLGRANSQGWVASPVVGVVENFHNATMKREIDPLIIRLRPRSDIDRWGRIILKLKGSDVPASLSQVERVWGEFSPEQPFVYSFLDTEINQFYRIDIQLGRILNGFSLLAILIACLGLFGLASFMAEQRTKEIGIRKVLGASVPGLIHLLCKDYLLLVVVAFVFAAPVSYIIMNRWLNEFAYRVDVSWEALIFVGAGALLVALVTVSYQSVKAALANPVQSLRYE